MSGPSGDVTGRAEAVLSWLRQGEDEMAAVLGELVAVPTENPPGQNYCACVDLLESHMRCVGLDCQRVGPGNPPECLLGTYGTGDRALYFHGHYDVVPAQARQQFQPLRKGHLMLGRGAADMKGGIVAMLFALAALKQVGARVHGRITLTLVPNEETGGRGGSAWLAEKGLLGRDGIGMLLPEPTSGVIWNANRGAISLRVRVFGKAAHVGLHHQGENAFERMHAVVERLQKLKREVEARTTKFTVGSDQARNSILLLGGESGGGTNFNIVPAVCWFSIDRRINPEEDLELEKRSLLGVLESCKRDGIPLEWEILQEGGSSSCRAEEPLGEAVARNVRIATGNAPRFEMCPGLLETRFYGARRIPAYAYGPGLLSVAHGPEEYVDLRRVADTAAIYALTSMEMLKP